MRAKLLESDSNESREAKDDFETYRPSTPTPPSAQNGSSLKDSLRLPLPQGDSSSDGGGSSPAGSPRPQRTSLAGLLHSTHRALVDGGSLLASIALGRNLDLPPPVPPRSNPPSLGERTPSEPEISQPRPLLTDPPVVDDLITFSTSEPLPRPLLDLALQRQELKPLPLTPPPPNPRERSGPRTPQVPHSPKAPRTPLSPPPQQQDSNSFSNSSGWVGSVGPGEWTHSVQAANGEQGCEAWEPHTESRRRSSHGLHASQLVLDLPLCQDTQDPDDKPPSSTSPYALHPHPGLWSPKTRRLEVSVIPRPRPSPVRHRIDPWSFISAGNSAGVGGGGGGWPARSPNRDAHLGYQPSPTNPFSSCDPFPSPDCDPFTLKADPDSRGRDCGVSPFDPFCAPFPTSRSAPCSANGSPTLPTFRIAPLNAADSPLIDLGWAGVGRSTDGTKERALPRKTLGLKPFKSPTQLRDDRF